MNKKAIEHLELTIGIIETQFKFYANNPEMLKKYKADLKLAKYLLSLCLEKQK